MDEREGTHILPRWCHGRLIQGLVFGFLPKAFLMDFSQHVAAPLLIETALQWNNQAETKWVSKLFVKEGRYRK